MKVLDPETKVVHYVKIEEEKDCGHHIITIGGHKFHSVEFMMMGFEFVEIDRTEMKQFNSFMDEVTFRLFETDEYFQGKMDGMAEAYEKEKGEKEDDTEE